MKYKKIQKGSLRILRTLLITLGLIFMITPLRSLGLSFWQTSEFMLGFSIAVLGWIWCYHSAGEDIK